MRKITDGLVVIRGHLDFKTLFTFAIFILKSNASSMLSYVLCMGNCDHYMKPLGNLVFKIFIWHKMRNRCSVSAKVWEPLWYSEVFE